MAFARFFAPARFQSLQKKAASVSWRKVGLVTGLVFLVGFLLVKTQSVNPRQHSIYNLLLLQLKEVDAILDRDLLKIRQGLISYYDPLVDDLNKLKQLQKELEQTPGYISWAGHQEIKKKLAAYEKVLQQKETLIESFKSKYSLLRNSLSYFPTIATENSAASNNPILTRKIQQLLYDILLYNLSSSEELAPKIKIEIKNLLDNRNEYSKNIERANFDIMMSHAQTIVKNKPQVDAIIKELILQPTFQKNEELYQVYNQYYENALSSANIYRLLLLISSIVLLSYVGFFVEILRRIVERVRQSVTQVNVLVAANEVEIRKLSQEAYNQVREINLTRTSVEQMVDSIQEVANRAKQAAAVMSATSQTAENGGQAMEKTVESFLSLRDTVAQTTEKVKQLSHSSQQIYKIVSLIEEIARQTKILSLNASVEASKGGERAAGFNVVAQEIGKLALQVGNATKEIKQIAQTIQSETNIVVRAMETGNAQVLGGTHLVEDTKKNLDEIVEVSRQIDELVRSISLSTLSQAQTSQTINALMEQIANISQKTSNLAERVSSSLNQTVSVAQELQESVSKFKLTTSANVDRKTF